MGKLKKFTFIAVGTVLLIFILWTVVAMTFSYSDGDRVGYVQKISNKGWIFKTWEGELAMVNMPGAMTEKFLFSVRDDAVAQSIQNTMGKRVRLSYEEHIGIPVSWFAETRYFVTGVEAVEGQ